MMPLHVVSFLHLTPLDVMMPLHVVSFLPVLACVGRVVGHIDAKTRRLRDSSAHDGPCQSEQDVPLLKPREAGEPEQGQDVPTPQREQKFRLLSSERAKCLESPA
jgi:hypothetical protein